MTDKTVYQIAVGRVIRQFRHLKKLSQEELAIRSSLHRTYIGSLERGERNPSILSIARILEGLDLSWEEFGTSLDDQIEKSSK